MDEYKELVREWVLTLDAEKQKSYGEKHMKDFDKGENRDVDIYDLQPKTPAVYDPPGAEDSDDV